MFYIQRRTLKFSTLFREIKAMTEVFKRPALPLVVRDAKRSRQDEGAIVLAPHQQQKELPRTSRLFAPNMLLTGHEGEIFAARFSPNGNCLVSVGYDRKILLWNVYGECENFSTLTGHTGSIMDVHFSSDSSHFYTCSTDKTVRIWDMETGACIRKFKSHTDFVNSCHPARRGPELICSGSDDGTIVIHDARKKEPAFRAENTNKYQVTAVSFGDMSEYIISGGIDNVVKMWDVRRSEVVNFLTGHTDTVTGLSLSPSGTHVLSNSMDCTARIWDVQPYAGTPQRCAGVLTGHQHNFEKNLLKCGWSADGKHVACGSSDRFSYVWNTATRQILYKLPGHQGSVNAVDFHPNEPILLTAGSDKMIYLGELNL